MQGERLQKVLANAGFGSRREIERQIADGRIRINGRIALLGDRVTRQDRISIGHRRVGAWQLDKIEQQVIAYNKPQGELVTRADPQGRATIFKHLPKLKKGRWIAVGRLDINTSGLLLLTTDGDLANNLMHPSNQIEREYAVRVQGEVTAEMLKQLVTGVLLDDGHARFEDIVESGGKGTNHWFHVVIMEGRKREVRRLWEAVGARVSRLKRVRFGPVMLDQRLLVGRWRELTPQESVALYLLAGLKKVNKSKVRRQHRSGRSSSNSKKTGPR